MSELKGTTRILGHLAMLGASLLILFPFVWIFLNSIKRPIDIFTGSWQFTPTINNYERLLNSKQANFMLNVGNSAIVAITSTLIVMTVATLAAYAITRFDWERSFKIAPLVIAALMGWILLFHMIPAITLVGPWYLIFRDVGLYNNLIGLILTHVTVNLPMATWLMMSFMQDVPKELEDAAWIDGCHRVGAFVRVVLPLVVPGLIAAGILSFIFSWNEFSIALNLTASATATIPVGISKFAQESEILYGEMAAGTVLATLPAIALMFFGQRFIVKGLTLGALK
jgi:multiple sugar transport system permease protein